MVYSYILHYIVYCFISSVNKQSGMVDIHTFWGRSGVQEASMGYRYCEIILYP